MALHRLTLNVSASLGAANRLRLWPKFTPVLRELSQLLISGDGTNSFRIYTAPDDESELTPFAAGTYQFQLHAEDGQDVTIIADKSVILEETADYVEVGLTDTDLFSFGGQTLCADEFNV